MKHYITEATLQQNASQLPIHMYTFPVADQQKRYEWGAKLRLALKKRNNKDIIVYKENVIATFEPLTNFGQQQPIHNERAIDPTNSFECDLLARLIKETLLVTGQNLQLKRVRGKLQINDSKDIQGVIIYPMLSFHITVKHDRIHIGFATTHNFAYKKTLQDKINYNEPIAPGTSVAHHDQKATYMYEFSAYTTYTVMDTLPEMNSSIYDYYKNKNPKVAASLNPSTAVVKLNANGKELFYAASLVREVCDFASLRGKQAKEVGNYIKQAPDERMKKQLRWVLDILQKVPLFAIVKNPFLITENGYTTHQLTPQSIYTTRAFQKPAQALKNGQVYKGGEIVYTIIFDETLPIDKALAYRFAITLQTMAKFHGVTLVFRPAKGDFTLEFFQNFDWSILALEQNYQQSAVLAMISQKQLDAGIYDKFKRQFGGKWDITSQIVTDKVLKKFKALLFNHNWQHFDYNDKQQCEQVARSMMADWDISYMLYNVLLGMYVKGGVQPWVLANRTVSDCFIGLDVSHENGVSTAGIMNIVGPNGQLIKQSAMAGALPGEKFTDDKLREILHDTLFAYQQVMQSLPTHITIHRDGRWFENTAVLQEVLAPKNIAFDIINVTKKPNRRMASYDAGQNKFVTQEGCYYVRDNEALLCATSPKESIGMAQPIKIVQVEGVLPIATVVEDIYKLSFMHIHCLNKTRLPATIHYADLSSTAYQRGQVAPRATSLTHLPFV